jgi:hypothetical protein
MWSGIGEVSQARPRPGPAAKAGAHHRTPDSAGPNAARLDATWGAPRASIQVEAPADDHTVTFAEGGQASKSPKRARSVAWPTPSNLYSAHDGSGILLNNTLIRPHGRLGGSS